MMLTDNLKMCWFSKYQQTNQINCIYTVQWGMEVGNITRENRGLAQNKPRVVVHRMNPHIRKTGNGKVVKRITWNSRRVDQRWHNLNRVEFIYYFVWVIYLHYNNCKSFLLSLNRKYPKQMHTMIPFHVTGINCMLHGHFVT